MEFGVSVVYTDSMPVAASLRNYAQLLRQLNRNSEADALDARAQTIESKVYSPSRP